MKTLPKTVLIVDDDEDFVEQQSLKLRERGYRVLTAEGEAEARKLLETVTPDCAVVDLMMGRMDAGLVLAYHIKKTNAEIPVVLVTAVTADTGVEFTTTKSPWIKADSILHKPVRFEQLLREVERLS